MAMLLAVMMFVQSSLGLLLPEHYRDVEWIKATWYGNDWVTLVAAVPLLSIAQRYAARGSIRGLLLLLGIGGYAVYNFAFYLFGAALNVFFPLYVANFLLGMAILVRAFARLNVTAVAASFRCQTPVRVIGGYQIFLAVGLGTVWLAMWGAYVFAGRPTPIEPEAFKVVAALDLSVLVPVLMIGGVLLWSRHPWGYVIAPIACVLGALYLTVLSMNSAIVIARGLGSSPGEVPVWGPLALFTAAAALVLLQNAGAAVDHR